MKNIQNMLWYIIFFSEITQTQCRPMEDLGLQNFTFDLCLSKHFEPFFLPLLNLFRLRLSKLEFSKSICFNFLLTNNTGVIWVAAIVTVFWWMVRKSWILQPLLHQPPLKHWQAPLNQTWPNLESKSKAQLCVCAGRDAGQGCMILLWWTQPGMVPGQCQAR